MNILTFQTFKNTLPELRFRDDLLICFLVYSRISPLLSWWFIKKKVAPNTITLLMIISGLIGAVLFSIPLLLCKIVGFMLFHLWFTLDCSDGEVARYTKKLSLFGREFDYMAHIINHPFFNLSLFLTYLQMGKYNVALLSIIFISFISIELIFRNLTSLQDMQDYKGNAIKKQAPAIKATNLKYLLEQLVLPVVLVQFEMAYQSFY